MTTILIVVIVCNSIHCDAQTCRYRLSGIVTDNHRHPVSGAVITVMPDSSKGGVTDTGGVFSIDNICAGHAFLVCNAFGYTTATAHIDISGNSDVRFTLSADNNQLHEIVVNGIRLQELHTVAHTELQGLALLHTRGGSLGDVLKELPGLNAIQTGPAISKPVIHGMHSNRVLILNNGTRQEGQQWGSEHAPEIDPFIANNITVVKGAASVRYGSDAIGGVVLLAPDPLPSAAGITGDIYAVGATNGRMGTGSASLQGAFGKKLQGLAWRVQGTMKRAGNFKTSSYYLKNTGVKEGDASASVGYKRGRLNALIYYSLFTTRNGIFEGSHVGNLADLYAAFSRPGTASNFSYDFGRSYQQVYHDLVKGSVNYRFANESKLELNVARQKDLREEYDLSLPYTTNTELLKKPQVSFQLITHSADVAYVQHPKNNFSGSTGITGSTQGNVFKGIRYLIPNFRNYTAGAYAIERYSYKKFVLEAGVRYDYRWQRVYQLDPKTLVPFNTTYEYKNATATIGGIYRLNEHFSVNLNTGTAWRAPSINEMYIHGIHFSDASYQDGDSTLQSERSWNTSLSTSYQSKKLRVSADVYYNNISNYIYEKPQLQPVTLISGTYPAFVFTQDNVTINGLDVSAQYDLLKYVTLQSKATIVRGYNHSLKDHLIYMPADRYENGVAFSLHKIRLLEEPYISLQNVSTLRQSRVPPNGDYVPPPAGYSIFNAVIGCSVPINKSNLHIDLSVNNFTNVAYRDYLDRFRYYADQLGINFMIRTKFSF